MSLLYARPQQQGTGRPDTAAQRYRQAVLAGINSTMIQPILERSLTELADVLAKMASMQASLQRLGDALIACWKQRGKVLIAGNGGSAADAVHLAEEFSVRYQKNRRALAAIALCDAAAITCCANDFGYEKVFSRQVEALGNPGDVLIVFTTSGNSPSIVRAVQAARERQMITCAFLGKGGGQLAGVCDIDLIIPSDATARIQEAHQLLFHVLCEWVDEKIE